MNISGSPLDFLFAFFGGIVVSLTPCVYPLIPISAAYIGARQSGSKLKGFSLSVTYVTGIAVTYSALGLIASLTGKIFGQISSSPITYILTGVIIILFGCSMFGIFDFVLPNLVKLPELKKQNYFSTFVLGLVSGLIIGPCTTPALGAILVFLATKKNILYGIILLFSFAYGMGLFLIIIGTFSSALTNLPKAGKWLEHAKKIGALILTGMGAYFIYIGIKRF